MWTSLLQFYIPQEGEEWGNCRVLRQHGNSIIEEPSRKWGTV